MEFPETIYITDLLHMNFDNIGDTVTYCV